MDAVKFLKEKQRMCKSLEECNECGFCECQDYCDDYAWMCPEKSVSIVESWAEAHPAKTRQSEFLKLFPNAPLRDGVLIICPDGCDSNTKCRGDDAKCVECLRDFWLKEIE